MTTLKNRKFSALAAALAASALIYSGVSTASPLTGLTPAEEKKMQYCEAGAAELNPDIAAECLSEKFLLDKLAGQDRNRWLRFIHKADVAKDLLDILEMHTDKCQLREALAARLAPGTPAAQFGLGPEPRKFHGWTARYKQEKLDLAQNAVPAYYMLKDDQKAWLKIKSVSADDWEQLPVSSRTILLSPFAENNARELLETPPDVNGTTIQRMFDKADDIYCDVAPETRARLNTHFENLDMVAHVQKAASHLLQGNRTELNKLNSEFKNIKTLPIAEQIARLRVLFENTPALRDPELLGIIVSQHELLISEKTQETSEKFARKDKKVISTILPTALLREIKGTLAGDRISAFFGQKNRPLKIKIASIITHAKFDHDTGEFFFNEKLVGYFLRTNNHKAEELQTNPEAVRGLARFLAPAFIHEAVHYEQMVWAKSGNFYYPAMQEDEIEAMSVEAVYLIEKMRKNPDFKEMLTSENASYAYLRDELDLARQMQEDPREFRRMIRRDYYFSLLSLEAAEAAYMTETGMPLIASELERRGKLPQAEQEDLRKSGFKNTGKRPLKEIIAKISTKDLEDDRDYYISWHSAYKERIQKHLGWADETLASILTEKIAKDFPPVPPPTGN